VGAGLPAMDVNDNAGCLNARVVRALFASRLAPTGAMQILVGASLNWSSNPGHRLRCLCRFLLHGYWRQVVVVAVEPDSVVSHKEAGHILPGFFNCRVALGGHPL